MDRSVTDAFCRYMATSGIFGLLEKSRAVVVGFSGGADSTLLLSLFEEYSKTCAHPFTVCAAHLNHMLRGDEAQRDNDFCKAFCNEHGIRFFEDKKDIYAVAEKLGLGCEEAGRHMRYKLFDDCRKTIADELGCTLSEVLISTAHNADDNLETVIFNQARGSGIKGLRGIVPVRDASFIRPLLCFTGREIREICREENILYVTDSTNESDEYTRNRIRHNVIPELEKINPEIQLTVLKMSAALAHDSDYLDSQARLTAEKYGVPFPCDVLKTLHPAISSRVIIMMYSAVSGEELSSLHISNLTEAISAGKSGKLHLPGNVTAYYGKNLEFRIEKDKNADRSYRIVLAEGENEFPEYGFSVGLYRSHDENNYDFSNIYRTLIYKVSINDKIKDNLYVRSREESDVYLFGGHHRKLKKLMCDKKIPLSVRDVFPVVCDGDGIVWVPGFPPRDGLNAEKGGNIGFVITYSEISRGEKK